MQSNRSIGIRFLDLDANLPYAKPFHFLYDKLEFVEAPLRALRWNLLPAIHEVAA